jgi:hypothetical protein
VRIGKTLSTLAFSAQLSGVAFEIDKFNPLQTLSRPSLPSPKRKRAFENNGPTRIGKKFASFNRSNAVVEAA